ncbi:MAG: SUMF1/EgtB/PvdO family nonheme iron enzyme [Armatimonadia bacterium]|nr:SUMF1/EgtB/PvdO family nonheme iron enzyme [Armatimonadia bacterium]
MNRCLPVLLACLFVAPFALAQDPDYYSKQDTWPETLLAARIAYAEAASEGSAGPEGVALGVWHSAGPFVAPEGSTSYEAAFPPQQGVDLNAEYDGGIGWTAHPEWQDGVPTALSAPTQGATYLYRTLTTDEARTLTVYLGSDDGLIAFLNGQQVLGQDVPRGYGPNQATCDLSLREGENDLLLKICNRTGGHGFYFHTEPQPAGDTASAEGQIWSLTLRDFPGEAERIARERDAGLWQGVWSPEDLPELAERYAAKCALPQLAQQARDLLTGDEGLADLSPLRDLYHRSATLAAGVEELESIDTQALRLGIEDLAAEYPEAYQPTELLDRLSDLDSEREAILADPADLEAAETAAGVAEALVELRYAALVESNPAIDFEEILFVRRRGNLGLPQNWQGNSSIAKTGYDNELALLPLGGEPRTLYRPGAGEFVGDLDLHWDAERLLFSMPRDGRWQVFEISPSDGQLRMITPAEPADIENFDACYLPDGRIIFCSTACYQGVPCVAGGDWVSLLYLLDPATGDIRQLTFDQDHSWDPTVLPDGRVLYTRWEYTDTPHYFTRLLFAMNPDGTAQMSLYGTNSYWPNSMFYARPMPGSDSALAAIISGHHGVAREGELILLDPGKGEREAGGVVQRIPGRGETVPPIIEDQLVASSWPRFLHPCPIDEDRMLVSCRPTPQSPWGIYLADRFDNLVLLYEDPTHACLEPIALKPRPLPRVVPDRARPGESHATIYLQDIYEGDGLAGVPRGTVKSLRVFEYQYAYPNMGGHIHIGVDGPWDVHRILGTVPVADDGSALFEVPANKPLAVQPLDSEGQSLQVMRSWFTAMPGENLSCVGCHESHGTVPAGGYGAASPKVPLEIEPWHGPERGFSFRREVQPVLDAYCVSCHDGDSALNLTDRPDSEGWSGFTPSYLALHPFVRRPGPESDYHLQNPGEFHADTSELVQLLAKGHHGVDLAPEAWDRLITWIDLNVPCHGTWSEHRPIPGDHHQRRIAHRKAFVGDATDPEAVPDVPRPRFQQATAAAPPPPTEPPQVDGWPFTRERAEAMAAEQPERELVLDLGEGVTLELLRVPAGRYVMGDSHGTPDEPRREVGIEEGFWMGRFEVTNAQFARFDPTHDSGYISETNKDQIRRGVPVNGPHQPVVRVSYEEAMAFCQWLSDRTGREVTLPTEAQWEWACRAGSERAFPWGGAGDDFSAYANLADHSVARLARRDSPPWMPRVDSVDDGALVTVDVGRYSPNPWGLYDIIGNAREWTRSTYAPGEPADGAEPPAGKAVVRGGSWYDRPNRARAGFRWGYPTWRRVFDVGFRVVVTER